MQQEMHEIPPVYQPESRILILGSFPSVKSREGKFYYHHPQNRFWKLLADLLQQEVPNSIEEKRELLLRNHIAIWDVIASCELTGSSDQSIRNVTPNAIEDLLQDTAITTIYTNGATASKFYRKYCYEKTGIKDIPLPSTSPANAAYSLERLEQAWAVILDEIKGKTSENKKIKKV